MQTLRLAEQLGAETVTLSGQRASETILSYARTRNVTKIVVGKPARPRWQEIVFGSTVDELVRRSGEIDVYVITGDPDADAAAGAAPDRAHQQLVGVWLGAAGAWRSAPRWPR